MLGSLPILRCQRLCRRKKAEHVGVHANMDAFRRLRRDLRSEKWTKLVILLTQGTPYILWCRRGPRPTSLTMAMYGTGLTCTACWARR